MAEWETTKAALELELEAEKKLVEQMEVTLAAYEKWQADVTSAQAEMGRNFGRKGGIPKLCL